jgi:hypothetical protein
MKKHNRIRIAQSIVSFLFVGILAPSSYGGMGDRFPIATTPQQEGCVSAAFDGTNFLAGIQGNALAHDGISWQLIDPTGELLGERGNQGAAGGVPLVGFGGGTYLVAWDAAGEGNTQVYGQRVNTAGTAVGAAFQISFSAGDTEPSDLSNIPFGGGNFLVVWEDLREGDGEDVYGQLVAASGVLMGPEIAIATNKYDNRNASVAFDGTNFLVVFTAERRPGMDDGEDVYGQFLSPSGSLVGGNFVIDENDIPSPNPTAVCWDGEKYTVLFHEGIEGAATGFIEQWDIVARFVSPGGIVATNRIAVAASPTASEQFPSLACDGTQYLATVSCMMGISTNFPAGTNMMSRARFFDKQLNPATPWFTLVDPAIPGVFPVGGAVSGIEKFAVGISLMDGGFNFSDVYGVMVDSAPPGIDGFGIQGTSANLSFTNLFQGTTNLVEQNASLMTNNWISVGEFFCTTTSTNWVDPVDPQWEKMFYRLRME